MSTTPRSRLARRLLAATGAAALAVLLPVGAANAADGQIAHVQSDGRTLQVLVSVPEGSQVDLAGVKATLDGTSLDATAESAADGASVRRTTVLAIDTSDSMAQEGRFTAAQAAASTFLDAAPDDVRIGVVTFNGDVDVALAPTDDRAAARKVVEGLTLAGGTKLYDGVAAAVRATGSEGQRSVLLISDGADAGSSARLGMVTSQLRDAGVLVDVVSLGQSGSALASLGSLARAGQGQVIESSGTALAATFRREADVLATQVLVSAPLPPSFSGQQASVEITLPTAGEPVVARALAPIQQAPAGSTTETDAATEPAAATVVSPDGWTAPSWVLTAGLAVLALGALGVAVLAVPGRPAPMTIAERVEAYSRTTTRTPTVASKAASEPVLDQARAAAAGVLERNRGYDEKLGRKLAAAGSELKPSEWLLVQVGSVIGAAVLGLLVGGGNLALGLLFVVLGALAPEVVLRIRAGRRVKAFQDNLPDVLQMLAGALSAGLSLAQAVDTIVREGPEPIASEFKRVLVETRIGVSLEDAFEGVAARYSSRDFAWAVMAIRIQRQVGGNLAELLLTVAATMRDRASLRRHVRALSAEGRMSAMILCGLPPGVLLYLLATNPVFLEPLYSDLRGMILSGFGVLWLSIGVFWMSRMVKVEI